MSSRVFPIELKIMSDVRPFHAWHYDPAQVSLERVIAPPYDVISNALQEELYQKSPYNCVRLILNREEPSDSARNNRYTRANACWESWRREHVLIREDSPFFYLYRQIFRDPTSIETKTRFALLGRLKLESFEKGTVIPHEKTLAKPREDRSKLLEATHINFSPVFGLFEDPEGEVMSSYEGVNDESPLFEITDDEGVRHALWKLQDEGTLEKIHERMAGRKIYIADGHHRYQTALEHAARERQRLGISDSEETPSDFVLTALVSFQDPGLVILATHRVILPFPGFDSGKAMTALKPFFKIEPLSFRALTARLTSFKRKEGKTEFGLCLDQNYYWLSLQDSRRARSKMPAAKPEIWYELDVNVLAHLILDSLWDLPQEKWESALRFTQSAPDALRAVQTREAAACFLLAPPPVQVLRDMGEARELMPQKSTFFYPKLASGLVFYHHDTPGV